MSNLRSWGLAAALLIGLLSSALLPFDAQSSAADPPTTVQVTGTLTFSPALTSAQVVQVYAQSREWYNKRGPVRWSNSAQLMLVVQPGDSPTFTFDLYAGTYRIQAFTEVDPRWGPTYLGNTGLGSASTTITVVEGQPKDVGNIVVAKTGSIAGTISIPSDAYGSAELELLGFNAGTNTYDPMPAPMGINPVTAEDGSFTIPNVPPGRYRLRIEPHDRRFAPVYWPTSRTLSGGHDLVVSSGLGAGANATLSAPRTVTIGARISGSNRYATAVAVTKAQFPANSGPHRIKVLYIASGADFPDALVAGPAAHEKGGALLLVAPTAISPVVWDEFTRLNPERVVIVGGTPSVAAEVEQQFAAVAPTTRIGGSNRYDTARKLVEDAFGCSGTDCAPIMFFANGQNYPDALTAVPAAATVGAPVLLIDGRVDTLDAATVETIAELGVLEAHVLGSSGSVSDALFTHLEDVMYHGVYRYGGANRYETSVLVNQEFFPRADTVFIATGQNFPDALAAGPLAAKLGSPLFLSRPNCSVPGFGFANLQLEDPTSVLESLDTRVVRILGGSVTNAAVTTPCS